MSESLTQSEADALVYGALTLDYMPAAHLWETLPISPAEIRASLLRLQEQGRAALVYGQGWRKLVPVVPDYYPGDDDPDWTGQ